MTRRTAHLTRLLLPLAILALTASGCAHKSRCGGHAPAGGDATGHPSCSRDAGRCEHDGPCPLHQGSGAKHPGSCSKHAEPAAKHGDCAAKHAGQGEHGDGSKHGCHHGSARPATAADAAGGGCPHAARKAQDTLSAAWDAAFRAGDTATLGDLYTDDAVLMAPGQPAIEGREAIAAHFGTLPPVLEAEMVVDEVEVRSDLAYVRGRFSMTMENPGGGDPLADRGKYLEIRRKQADGSWKIAVDTYSSDL